MWLYCKEKLKARILLYITRIITRITRNVAFQMGLFQLLVASLVAFVYTQCSF